VYELVELLLLLLLVNLLVYPLVTAALASSSFFCLSSMFLFHCGMSSVVAYAEDEDVEELDALDARLLEALLLDGTYFEVDSIMLTSSDRLRLKALALRADHGSSSASTDCPLEIELLNLFLSPSSVCSLKSRKQRLQRVGHLTWGWNPNGQRGSDDLP
jgi:hypothetical protein